MKTLLTVIVCGDCEKTDLQYDGIELIYPEDGEKEKNYLVRASKAAKGKYAVLCLQPFTFADVKPLMQILDKNTTDMVCFTGGAAIKTSIIKSSAKDCADAFSCKILSVLDCKNLLKTVYTPFAFGKSVNKFCTENEDGLLLAAETFGKVKGNLSKEIYTHASNLLCDRLVAYYMYAMITIREGGMPKEQLVSFDGRIKAEIVLYLALDKRFTAAKLNKLRGKEFKISFFTANKFKKLLNIK